MTSDELFAKIKAAAIEMNLCYGFGALHIFVADGNCEDEHIEFCLRDPRITAKEADFAQRMLEQFTEEERAAVYAFAHCSDIPCHQYDDEMHKDYLPHAS